MFHQESFLGQRIGGSQVFPCTRVLAPQLLPAQTHTARLDRPTKGIFKGLRIRQEIDIVTTTRSLARFGTVLLSIRRLVLAAVVRSLSSVLLLRFQLSAQGDVAGGIALIVRCPHLTDLVFDRVWLSHSIGITSRYLTKVGSLR